MKKLLLLVVMPALSLSVMALSLPDEPGTVISKMRVMTPIPSRTAVYPTPTGTLPVKENYLTQKVRGGPTSIHNKGAYLTPNP